MNITRLKAITAAGAVGALTASLGVAAGATPAFAATDIRIGTVAINAAGVIPYARDNAIFAKNGLNVTELKIFPAPPPSIAALAAGAVDFIYAPSIAIINAYANGGVALKVVAVGDGYQKTVLQQAKKDAALAKKLDDTGVCVSPTSGM